MAWMGMARTRFRRRTCRRRVHRRHVRTALCLWRLLRRTVCVVLWLLRRAIHRVWLLRRSLRHLREPGLHRLSSLFGLLRGRLFVRAHGLGWIPLGPLLRLLSAVRADRTGHMPG